MSERWVKQLKQAVQHFGEEVVTQGNAGRHPANEELRWRIIALK
jgi:hypothetical protein